MMTEMPELHDLCPQSKEVLEKPYEQMDEGERTRIHYCDSIIALCETV